MKSFAELTIQRADQISAELNKVGPDELAKAEWLRREAQWLHDIHAAHARDREQLRSNILTVPGAGGIDLTVFMTGLFAGAIIMGLVRLGI